MSQFYRKILRHPERCTGCRSCEIACSFAHEGSFRPSVSKIRVLSEKQREFFVPSMCLHCENPVCVSVCRKGAREKDPETGIVVYHEEKCVKCRQCIRACPNEGLFFDPNEKRIFSCDFCGGHPACVEACTQNALSLSDLNPIREALESGEDLMSPGLAACQGCAAEWAVRFTLRVLGRNTVVGLPPCCMSATGLVGFGTNTGAKIPITFTHLGNAASMMAGVKHHFQRRGRDVHVVAVAGDGGSADIGLQALSAAAERGDNILYICYDNEAYMNTGIQRSGTTPSGSWTTTTPVGQAGRGKSQPSKDLPAIMLMHNLPYVATACTSYPEDYLAKLKKAREVKDGLAYIHILAPCPIGWRFPSERAAEVGRLAVETNFFPLWEAERGRIRFTREIKYPLPIEAYTRAMGKYRHLTWDEIDRMQQDVDDRYRKLVALAGCY